jgi:sialate O-acetylesterase
MPRFRLERHIPSGRKAPPTAFANTPKLAPTIQPLKGGARAQTVGIAFEEAILSTSVCLMISLRSFPFATCLGLLLAATLHAGVACPAIFGDHMVLQRDQPVAVWGTAGPGDQITVTFAGQNVTTTADATGLWRVTLEKLKASTQPNTLTVTAINRESQIENLEFQDVLVGEVWFCSGQSNMEKQLGPRKGQKPTDDYEAELTRADCPPLRLFQGLHTLKPKPGDVTLEWHPCSAEALTAMEFSAAAYYFGRELVRELGVPVGLIHSSFGGTRIEGWIPSETFAVTPELRGLDKIPYESWVSGVQATELYQSRVAPYVPFTLRGFLWYQGEANVMNAEHLAYATKLRALIGAWRAAWGAPEAPFYFAQLAPFNYSHIKVWSKQLTPLALPAIWEAQLAALDVPHTGLIPTSDLAGTGGDIHPTNKRDVGLRFARLALAETYGRKDVAAQAPRLKSARLVGVATYEIALEHADGLHTEGNVAATGFQLAGEDRVFHPADATYHVEGRILVTSQAVIRPVALRFAWDELAMPNLVNAAGLPALPFRTDDWPLVLEVPKEK